MSKRILSIGAFDTKGEEYDFLHAQIGSLGGHIVAMNTGVLGTTDRFEVDIEAADVAAAGGVALETLREARDRGHAMQVMASGAARLCRRLYDEGQIDGVVGMGGSGGSSVITAAMRALPIGIPKVCVSTVAGSDTSGYVGFKDVVLIPSIVDVAGVNRISAKVFAQAAGAIVGMVGFEKPEVVNEKPIIAASMFGNTTECVDACREQLTDRGFEVLVFHATGTGGKAMESLIHEGLVDACLDITTTEWADELCGGVFGAGDDRLSAAGRCGVPHLIVPGCVDMVNFGAIESVPESYRKSNRKFYEWNPAVTLMRTNIEENRRMGEIFAQKANDASGPVAFLLPLDGVSILDGAGELFCDRDADRAMFDAIKQNVRSDIPVFEMDKNINDKKFADRAVEILIELISRQNERGSES